MKNIKIKKMLTAGALAVGLAVGAGTTSAHAATATYCDRVTKQNEIVTETGTTSVLGRSGTYAVLGGASGSYIKVQAWLGDVSAIGNVEVQIKGPAGRQPSKAKWWFQPGQDEKGVTQKFTAMIEDAKMNFSMPSDTKSSVIELSDGWKVEVNSDQLRECVIAKNGEYEYKTCGIKEDFTANGLTLKTDDGNNSFEVIRVPKDSISQSQANQIGLEYVSNEILIDHTPGIDEEIVPIRARSGTLSSLAIWK